MRVAASIQISAPASDVWAFVDDPARYLHVMSGVTRWEVEGEQATGLGARYRMLMRVGSAEIGGQETALFLSRGETLARVLMLDKMFRLKVLPISVALPWGINVGDFLGHVPLPAKITVEALPPIYLREEFGDDPDVDEVYEHVLRLMQETLDALASERRLPVIG